MKIEIVTEFGKTTTDVKTSEEMYTDHLSPESIEGIKHGIEEAGYDAHIFGGIPELTASYANKISIDKDALYFNISNGMTQASRRMQAPILCEMLEVNYSGSAPFTVALMNNKYFTKKAVQDLVRIPEDVFLDSVHNVVSNVDKIKKYPIIIKPNGEGGSYGIHQDNVVYDKEDAISKARNLLGIYSEVLLEELISGTEITNLIIGNRGDYLLNEILVYKTYGQFEHKDLVRSIEIKTQNVSQIYSICDYTNNHDLIDNIKNTSIAIFEKLGCRDIARIDYKINPEGELYFLEINSNPNIYAKYIDVICKKNSLTYPDFLSLIIKAACQRYNK